MKVNITDKSDTHSQAIKKKYKIFGTPSFVFFDNKGIELKNDEFYGYQRAEEFLDTIELIAD